MIHTFFHAKAWFFTGESFLCDWEPYLVSQLSWLKGACNRFQTHKRFKRLEVYKSDVVAQCCTMLHNEKQNKWLSQSDHFPSWEGKQSDWLLFLSELSHDWLPESGCQPANQTDIPNDVIWIWMVKSGWPSHEISLKYKAVHSPKNCWVVYFISHN